jgi:AcrR family transcriptional regulator
VSSTPDRNDAPERRVRKGELTAERILDAAEESFAKRGFAATTMRDVAASVGIRIPSLYNHFEHKEALYAAVLERDLRPVLKALGENVSSEQGGHSNAREVVRTVMRIAAEHPRLAGLIQHEILTQGAHLTPMLRDWMLPILGRADESVEAELDSSRWDEDERRLIVLAMYNMTVGYFTIASFYKDLNGRDLLSEDMLEKQAGVLGDLIDMIFTAGRKTP